MSLGELLWGFKDLSLKWNIFIWI